MTNTEKLNDFLFFLNTNDISYENTAYFIVNWSNIINTNNNTESIKIIINDLSYYWGEYSKYDLVIDKLTDLINEY